MLVLPHAFILGSAYFESGVGARMQYTTRLAATAAERLLTGPSPLSPQERETELEAIAAHHAVRLRVVNDGPTLLADLDRESGASLFDAIGNLFFGPDGAPTLAAFDATLPPIAEREESRAAAERGPGAIDNGCRFSPERKLQVCHAVLRTAPSPACGDGCLVYVQESSRRAIRALYDLRYQMLKLALFVLPLGLLLAWWMGHALVRPFTELRADLLRRARTAVPNADIDIGRRGEVAELASAFNSLLAALGERTRANEAFLADLAHEFKNPVAAIRAAAENLSSGTSLDAQRVARLAALIHHSSVRLDGLVTELLELARAEAGLWNEPREAVDVAALAAGLVESCRADPRYAGREVVCILPPDGETAVVVGVGRRLERAFANLLDNAASFAGAEGGRVEVRVAPHGDAVTVSVRDNGPGIAAADLPRIFARFFTTRGDRRGTGLGLALAKAIVEAHAGTITVTSTPGHGAELCVVLPGGADAARVAAAATHSP